MQQSLSQLFHRELSQVVNWVKRYYFKGLSCPLLYRCEPSSSGVAPWKNPSQAMAPNMIKHKSKSLLKCANCQCVIHVWALVDKAGLKVHLQCTQNTWAEQNWVFTWKPLSSPSLCFPPALLWILVSEVAAPLLCCLAAFQAHQPGSSSGTWSCPTWRRSNRPWSGHSPSSPPTQPSPRGSTSWRTPCGTLCPLLWRFCSHSGLRDLSYHYR